MLSPPEDILAVQYEINLFMNSANSIPRPSDLCGTSSQHFPFEVAAPETLDYWQSNLRSALDHAKASLKDWLLEGRCKLEAEDSETRETVVQRTSEQLPHRGLLVRFPQADALDAAFVARVQKVDPDHLYVLHRVATSWDRLRIQAPTSNAPRTVDTPRAIDTPGVIDPVAFTRSIHLNLRLRLHRQQTFKRRNAAIELSEFRTDKD